MALEFFCEGLRDDVRLDLRLDIQLLQPPVLLLKLLHPSHQRGVHTAEFRPPLVERRRADPVLSAELWYRNPGLRLLQDRQDLAVRKPRLLHVELLSEKILLLRPPPLWGDYHENIAIRRNDFISNFRMRGDPN